MAAPNARGRAQSPGKLSVFTDSISHVMEAGAAGIHGNYEKTRTLPHFLHASMENLILQ